MFAEKDHFRELFEQFKKHLSHDNYDAINELVGSPQWLNLRFKKANRAAEVELPAILYSMDRVRDILDAKQGSIAEACTIFGSNIWNYIGHKDKLKLEEQFCAQVSDILDDMSNTGRSGLAVSRLQQELKYLDANLDLKERMERILQEYQEIRSRRDDLILKKKELIEFLIKNENYDEAESVLKDIITTYGSEIESLKNLSSEIALLKLRIENERKRLLLDGKSLQQRVKQLSATTSYLSLEELETLRSDLFDFVKLNPEMPAARRLEQEFLSKTKRYLLGKTLHINETLGPDEAVKWFTEYVLTSNFASSFSNLSEYPELKAVFRSCFESSLKKIKTKTTALLFDDTLAELSRFDHRTCSLYSLEEAGRRSKLHDRIERFRNSTRDIHNEKELLDELCIAVDAYEGSPLSELRTERGDKLAAMLSVINTPYHDLSSPDLATAISELETISKADDGRVGREAEKKIRTLQTEKLRIEASRARMDQDLHREQQCLLQLLALHPNDTDSAKRLSAVRNEYRTQNQTFEKGKQELSEHQLNKAISSLSAVTDINLSSEAAQLLKQARSDAELYNNQARKILPELDYATTYPLAEATDADLSTMRESLSLLNESFKDSPVIEERLEMVKMERSIRNKILTISELRQEYGNNITALLDQDVVTESLKKHGTHPHMSKEINLLASAIQDSYIAQTENKELHKARSLYRKFLKLPADAFKRDYLSFAENDPLHISRLERDLEEAGQQARFAIMELEKLRLPEGAAYIKKASAICSDLPQLISAMDMRERIAEGQEIMFRVDRNLDSPADMSDTQLEELSSELDRAARLLPAEGNLRLLNLKYGSISDYRRMVTEQTGIKGRMLLHIVNRGGYLILMDESYFGNRKAAENHNAIALTAPMIKEKHAKISFIDDIPVLESIDGKLTVNGKKCDKLSLNKGDELKLGLNFRCRVDAADSNALVLTPHVASQIASASQIKSIVLINRRLLFSADNSGHIKIPQLHHQFELLRSDNSLQLYSKDGNKEIKPGAEITLQESNVSFTFNSEVR
ncbi:hypothetical protein [Desulfovibrio sp. JC022]|uniref:hypothetical protein n=1 Tax=Desulfovibrio sp. JC022 TaxID=2593642 RepID=UPI0013D1C34B|nr:hypothetical protein [Desulfovibrio sp. JC022]NDV22608.1 hypothetical protein [Desulfovibrio sp. JC022]